MNQSRLKLLTAFALAGVWSAATSSAVTISTVAGATTTGGAVSATADFTFGAGFVDLTLTNLSHNPVSPAQLLSGLYFDVVGASLAGSLTRTISAPSGKVVIADGGTYTISAVSSSSSFVAQANSLDRWQASGSGSTVTLTTLSGGNPNYLIIGSDNGSGLYDAANTGVINDNPSILGSIVTRITLAGVTAGSTLGNVTFQFGTSASGNQTTTTPPNGNEPPAVPDSGTTLLLLGGALIGVALIRYALR